MIEIVIKGEPIGKARPRFVRRGKFVSTYSAQATEEGRWILMAQEQIKAPCSGPLHVSCEFYMKRPKGHYGTGKNAGVLKDWAVEAQHTKKPDIDNLVKFCFDCLNGIAWDDDAAVVSCSCLKQFDDGDGPRTIIKVWDKGA